MSLLCGLGSTGKILLAFTKDFDKCTDSLYKIAWGDLWGWKQARGLSGNRKKVKENWNKDCNCL